ncbi:SAV0927 family protein [Tumebacillus algifaecis]|nr:SAV0927 family protein [Tumebacillus algifaecis]
MISHESYEESRSRFVTLVTDHSQYDLVISYSSHFLGKALILHIQTNLFDIFDLHDVRDHATFGAKLGIANCEDAELVSDYLEDVMPMIYTPTQY